MRYTLTYGMPWRLYHKIMLIMRLTTVILIASLMQVTAGTFGQNITLNIKQAPLKNVLKEIKNQSGYSFFYYSDVVANSKISELRLQNATLNEALTSVCSGLGLGFEINGKIVTIKKKEPSIVGNLISRFQEIDIRGKILDENGLPLAGATIKIKSSNKSTKTNTLGEFSLQGIDENAVLEISFIGYVVKEIKAATNIGAINMMLADANLEEVMINAGYYTVKDSERTGSISRITSKDIESQPVTNIIATMQGRMAGVNVTQTTGVPGGGFNIQIRGQNSIRTEGNAPLYIIDGVPYSSEPIGYAQTSTIFPVNTTSPLNSITPDAIESIEILKDADATAIYGSRGANGVVLISTKRAKAGKVAFTLTPSTGVGTVTKFGEFMNTEQYLNMRREAFVNDKRATFGAGDYDINGTWDQNRFTDWQQELLGGNARINNLQGTISGGSEQTQFLFSGSYNRETTVFPGDFAYQKGGSRLTLNHQSNDKKFQFVFTGGYSLQNNNQPAADLSNEARLLVPNAPALYDAAGNLNWENNTWINPLASLQNLYKSNTKDFVSNAVLSYVIVPNLMFKASFGYTDLQYGETRTTPSTSASPSFGYTSVNSILYVNNTKRNSWIIEPQVNWERQIGAGKLGVLVGGSIQQQNNNRLYQSGSNFSSNSLIYDFASAVTQRTQVSDETLYKYQGIFGRLNYNVKDRYFLNLTARRDGSSRFGPGNQFANFGAMGMAWLFSRENIFKNSSWLSFGKLRASYGITGSDQIGDYQFLDTYTSSGVSYQTVVGLQPSRLYNANFGWENNKKLEAALELGFLADRLFFTGAYYQNRSSNQLVGIPLSGLTGFNQIQANLNATVENTGWEFTLRTSNFSTGNFKWTSSVNLSIARNKLVSFPNLKGSTYKDKYRIGEPLNIQLSYKYIGVDPQTGIYQFVDENKDGRLTSPDDRQTIVDLNPAYFGGLQNQLSYKKWNLDLLFQFVKQQNISAGGIPGMQYAQPIRFLDSWKKAGDITSYQIYTTGYNSAALNAQNQYSTSDAGIVDASYIRLKTASLTYDIPIKTKGITCRAMLQGQNLLTFTRYVDGDPEFKSFGYLPPLKVFTAGVQFTF